MNAKNKRRWMVILMLCLILIWSFDYIVAKHALKTLEPLSLLYIKYIVGLIFMVVIKAFTDPGWKLRKKDVSTLVICSILGEIMYFYCEYSAMDSLPISIITILLAFVPAVSILVEIGVYGIIPSRRLMMGILLSAVGVILIIGVDARELLQGRLTGYLFVFGAILAWNAYNFITANLHKEYSSISLTVMQLACTILILTPYMIFNFPSRDLFTADIIGGIMYLGIFGAGIGFYIQVKALSILGPTSTSLFSNFMPVVATIMGWVLLNETISLLQAAGGALVIVSGYFVIKEKGKVEESLK